MKCLSQHTYVAWLTSVVLAGASLVVVLPVWAQEDSVETLETEAVTSTTSSEPSTDPTDYGYSIEGFPGSDAVIGDFVVGPGKVEVSLKPGESKLVEISATNRTGVDRIFKFRAEDMTGSTDLSQSVVLLGDDRGPYSLRDYLDIPDSGLLIKHGQRVRIPVRVSIPANAQPGGLYGSVLTETVTVTAEEAAASGAVSRSPLVTRVGTLFFVTVEGAVERSATLQSFGTTGNKKFFGSGPITFSIVHENTGNIHVTPYGELEIYNLAGESVGFVELDPWFVMPKSLRNREVTWTRELLVGKYTAILRVNRGYDNIVDESSFTFWVIPWKLAALVFVGCFVFFFLIRFIATRFEFKRKT